MVLRITTFNDQTYPNLVDGLEKQVNEAGGMENINGIVLDLRNNPGGLLNQAIRVSDAFLEKEKLFPHAVDTAKIVNDILQSRETWQMESQLLS